ncbi:unnamed protein product [Prorocentrum cordatum]|uniref:Uncharacterized protein n=2 Tax=Prorocentrum cordatum TaxID=2364126 RepID=A0ABN9UUD3_9DINO|nr:unnamed protein product [Polarella glacialis]
MKFSGGESMSDISAFRGAAGKCCPDVSVQPVPLSADGERTQLNEPLVIKRSRDFQFVLAGFKVNGEHQVLFDLTVPPQRSCAEVRVAENRDSEPKAVIRPGTIVTILAIGMSDNTRAKVHGKGRADTPGVDGWITLLSKYGDLTLGPVEDQRKEVAIEFAPKYLKIKGMLQASVRGDLPGMKKILEGGFMARHRPDVNCTDARGKSALMFAAACGHRDVVEYLLSHKKLIEVNSVDNTNKTALHHAATRSRKSPKLAQTGIIRLLLTHGCALEAAADAAADEAAEASDPTRHMSNKGNS